MEAMLGAFFFLHNAHIQTDVRINKGNTFGAVPLQTTTWMYFGTRGGDKMAPLYSFTEDDQTGS